MGLTGYRRTANKRNGGIRSVAIVEAAAVIGATKGAAESISAVSLAAGKEFALYHPREDEARYTETVTADGLVAHELTLTLERMDGETRRAVEELLAASPGGMVAIVATNNGNALLAGWSERFGCEYPLRLHAVAGGTGRTLSDLSAETITLRSVDTAKALAYTGT